MEPFEKVTSVVIGETGGAARHRLWKWSGAARTVFLGLLLLRPVSAAAAEPSPVLDDPVIPAGHEQLLAAMLGKGVQLPGGCTLVSGEIEYSIVVATYSCPWGEVVLELGHSSNATPTSILTEKFALTLQSGSAPEAFGEALAQLIRSREAAFQWAWAEEKPVQGEEN
jgi:hypothetical protein